MRFICSDIGSYILHYNVLIIICYRRSKRVNGKIICLCTRSEENMFTYKIFKSSTATVSIYVLEAEMLCLCVLCKYVNGNLYKHSVLLEKKFVTKHMNL